MLKADYEKAYDCVSLNVLRYMLRRLGFEGRLMMWMEIMHNCSSLRHHEECWLKFM